MPRPIVPSPRDKREIESETMNRKCYNQSLDSSTSSGISRIKSRSLSKMNGAQRRKELKTPKKEGEVSLSVSLNV